MSASPSLTADGGRRRYGLLMVSAGSVLWSTGGLFVRALDIDVWTLQGWRSLFSLVTLLVLIAIEEGRGTWGAIVGIGRPGLIAVPIAAISIIAYIAALEATTVANVVIMYATVPLMAAGIAWAWIGERANRRAIIAALGALAGIVVMAGGAARADDLLGDALAVVMTLTFAILVVMARRYPRLSMAAVNLLGAALMGLAVLPFMSPAVPSLRDLIVLALFAVCTTGLAFHLFLLGARHIPAAESGLLGLLDTVLSPVWVWLVFGEQPAGATLLGGLIVLAAVTWHLAGGRR